MGVIIPCGSNKNYGMKSQSALRGQKNCWYRIFILFLYLENLGFSIIFAIVRPRARLLGALEMKYGDEVYV